MVSLLLAIRMKVEFCISNSNGQQSVYVSFVTYPDLFARLFFSLVGALFYIQSLSFRFTKEDSQKKALFLYPDRKTR